MQIVSINGIEHIVLRKRQTVGKTTDLLLVDREKGFVTTVTQTPAPPPRERSPAELYASRFRL
ncbi:hypothetical protein [Beijerinckia sp. L45]|uniref:hypothetical protein n=1 Tax=Beijerinckia sp. L45 TaxID=1641855 RepID=UPI00131B492B|nr:hypothetical protein [Beijerinckia sp. L45]